MPLFRQMVVIAGTSFVNTPALTDGPGSDSTFVDTGHGKVSLSNYAFAQIASYVLHP